MVFILIRVVLCDSSQTSVGKTTKETQVSLSHIYIYIYMIIIAIIIFFIFLRLRSKEKKKHIKSEVLIIQVFIY